MAKARQLHEQIHEAYADYDFARVVASLQNFCSNEMGALYLDVTKDRLYTMQAGSHGRRSAQTAMHAIAHVLVRALAPILSFTAEEIWQQIPGRKADSVFLVDNAEIEILLPPSGSYLQSDGAAMQYLLAMRDAVSKVLEPMRADGLIGAALQAEVTVYGDHAALAGMNFGDELRFFFITSQLRLEGLDHVDAHAVAVEGTPFKVLAKVSGHGKCVRCWHYAVSVGVDAEDPELCARCMSNVNGAGEQRSYF
jgi:isoleucyl-tRNA synthetase